MEKIISNIKKNKKYKKTKTDDLMTTFELELNYKIECEKTKQLELIKDIRKIEKNIKEKELYNKRKNNINFTKNMCSNNSDSDSELDSDLNSDLDLESNDLQSIESDSISICSYNSVYSYKEIEISNN